MKNVSVLIANRGEIAVRIIRAVAELGWRSVAVYSPEDEASLHVRLADEAVAIAGTGPSAYLDAASMIDAARSAGCGAIHPGYGFLSENAAFAQRCHEDNLVFIGPDIDTLAQLGDKAAARELARKLDVPLLPGTAARTSLAEAQAFMDSRESGGAIMLKALAGGGGRGIRAVSDNSLLAEGFARCSSEAARAFGDDSLYVEKFLEEARHIEVQIVGDGSGTVAHIGERECTLQRRNQKLVEFAPSPSLRQRTRDAICDAAVRMAASLSYKGLGTFEFLVDERDGQFYFIEANPRIQVEHTVTEEVFGIDLVQVQLLISHGASLSDVGLAAGTLSKPRGFAIQIRVNAEKVGKDGGVQPATGTLAAYTMPAGPGVRIDGCGYTGLAVNSLFDPLLTKIIVSSNGPLTIEGFGRAVRKARRILDECRIEGVNTNLPFLRALLADPQVELNAITTRYVEQSNERLADIASRLTPLEGASGFEVLDEIIPGDAWPIRAPGIGRVVSVSVVCNDYLKVGDAVAVIEAMKMEHLIAADKSGIVTETRIAIGDFVAEGDILCLIEPDGETIGEAREGEVASPYLVPDMLEDVHRAQALLYDDKRPEAVSKRRRAGLRTARENIDDLCDSDSLMEYGGLAVAAQRQLFPLEELQRISPADGLICGIASVNGDRFTPAAARCAVMAYDYTVFAGTQGIANHKKMDRLFTIIAEQRIPLVVFTEGGGGRPSDTDEIWVGGGNSSTFARLGKLSGRAPTIGIAAGRCFAGNAAVLGCCDVIIATRGSTIGMGGPAMIEGGGLGVFTPEEVGPSDVMAANGVIDILVEDEAEGVREAKRYLSYFQGSVEDWEGADQRLLRSIVPENRRRIYDVRRIIGLMADTGSVLELRPQFGVGMVTALARIEGKPFGIIANNVKHLGGAIDGDGADKAARFVQMCDLYSLPILSLCDTPGFMVGPETEKGAVVRRFSRLFVKSAALSVPWMTVVLRKAYGLGAMAMGGGSFHESLFTIAWPTGEFGGMGLEGAVRLGYRKELQRIADPEERGQAFDRMVAEAYERGNALNVASLFEIDNVIDPADTRRFVAQTLHSHHYAKFGSASHAYLDPF